MKRKIDITNSTDISANFELSEDQRAQLDKVIEKSRKKLSKKIKEILKSND